MIRLPIPHTRSEWIQLIIAGVLVVGMLSYVLLAGPPPGMKSGTVIEPPPTTAPALQLKPTVTAQPAATAAQPQQPRSSAVIAPESQFLLAPAGTYAAWSPDKAVNVDISQRRYSIVSHWTLIKLDDGAMLWMIGEVQR